MSNITDLQLIVLACIFGPPVMVGLILFVMLVFAMALDLIGRIQR